MRGADLPTSFKKRMDVEEWMACTYYGDGAAKRQYDIGADASKRNVERQVTHTCILHTEESYEIGGWPTFVFG
jgi:hypothetical protein